MEVRFPVAVFAVLRDVGKSCTILLTETIDVDLCFYEGTVVETFLHVFALVTGVFLAAKVGRLF
jgi:hypothetical protein